jgi:hypothetical protein
MRIPIIRYCSRVWPSVVSIESRIHRVFDGCDSNSLQRCYYGRVRSRFCMDVRECRHCIGRWSWLRRSCRDRLVVDVEFKMGRLRAKPPSTDRVDPFLVFDLHGHDDNPRNDPSRPCAAKPPILSGRPSVINYAIHSLHLGTRNQILRLYHKRTNVLS